MIKKVLILVILMVILIPTTTIGSPKISSKAAILIDKTSGRILYEHNAYIRLPMASTTKIMTALITIENNNLNRIVKIPKEAVGIEGSSIWLESDEELTIKDLLYGLMIRSGNDAAVALAILTAGNIEKFVNMMNDRAISIGALNTNFVNPHGLHHQDHYTTAYDLALISREAMKNPTFREIVSTKRVNIPWQSKEWDRALVSRNRILNEYPGGNGIKTGYTTRAGSCLVSSSTRHGGELIAVVLGAAGSSTMWNESKILLDYGFNNFTFKKVVSTDEVFGKVKVDKGHIKEIELRSKEDVIIPVLNNEKIELLVDIPNSINAPVLYNQVIGEYFIQLNGKLIFKDKIYSDVYIPRKTIVSNFYKIIYNWIEFNTQFQVLDLVCQIRNLKSMTY